MIPISNKGEVPASLAYPPSIGKPSVKTHQRRMKLIKDGKYADTPNYNNRYKQKDTKKALKTCHHRKCAYCEQVVEAAHVEHYRPKSVYWWLAYSWDNLLRVCPTCNTHKLNNFKILGTKAVYNPKDLPQIHALRDIYNQLEMPLLLNPECDDLSKMWTFKRNGEMNSNNDRGQYTISTLKLNRKKLQDSRKKLIDTFQKRANDRYFLYENNPTRLFEKLSDLADEFIETSEDPEEKFLAFRHYAEFNFIIDIIQKYNSKI